MKTNLKKRSFNDLVFIFKIITNVFRIHLYSNRRINIRTVYNVYNTSHITTDYIHKYNKTNFSLTKCPREKKQKKINLRNYIITSTLFKVIHSQSSF